MFNSSAERALAFQQAAPPQTPQKPNPIESGARQGIEVAKASIEQREAAKQQQQQMQQQAQQQRHQEMQRRKAELEMNDMEKQRTMGRALIAYASHSASHPPQVGSGFGGAIGSMTAALQPGMKAYDDERDSVAKTNAWLQQQMLAQEQKQQEHEYRNAVLGETRRHNKATEAKGSGAPVALPDGRVSIPLANVSPQLKNTYVKELQERQKGYHSVKKILETYDRMEKLYEKNKDFFGSERALMYAGMPKNKLEAQFRKGYLTKKEYDAADLMNKETNVLVQAQMGELKGLGPGAGTDVMKDILKQSTPGAMFSYDVGMSLINTGRESGLTKFQDIIEANEALRNQYYVPIKIMGSDAYGEEMPAEQTEQGAMTGGQTDVPRGTMGGFTPEELAQAAAELEAEGQ